MHEHHAFVFTCDGRPFGSAARTLKEFVGRLEAAPDASVDGHARRSDFSRWIADVFGDQPLAGAVRKVERRHQQGGISALRAAVIAAIRERYELTGAATGAGPEGRAGGHGSQAQQGPGTSGEEMLPASVVVAPARTPPTADPVPGVIPPAPASIPSTCGNGSSSGPTSTHRTGI